MHIFISLRQLSLKMVVTACVYSTPYILHMSVYVYSTKPLNDSFLLPNPYYTYLVFFKKFWSILWHADSSIKVNYLAVSVREIAPYTSMFMVVRQFTEL